MTIVGTQFPVGAEVTRLRLAGQELSIPTGDQAITADEDGGFTLVFNIPSNMNLGFYMIEVEAEAAELSQPVFIAKPFDITSSTEESFNLWANPAWIKGVEQGQSGNTKVNIEATGQQAEVTLSVEGLPFGANANFTPGNKITAPPGGQSSCTLTITTSASTPPGKYPLLIRGVSGDKERVVNFGFGVIMPEAFAIPELTLDPEFAPAGYRDKQLKVTFSGQGFPAGQNISSIDFGGQAIDLPPGLKTDAAGGTFNGVFQMPTGLDPGTYNVTVAVATPAGGFIYGSAPFTIKGSDSKFNLKLSPPYLPPVMQGNSVNTTINVTSVSTSSVNVTLHVDGLPPGITADFSPGNTLSVSPGSSGSAMVILDVSQSTPPGPYPLSIRGVSGTESVVVPLGFGVMPDIGGGEGHASITINPPRGRPGENIGISGAGFSKGETVTLNAAPPGAPVEIDITPGNITVQDDGTWATQITVPSADQVPAGTYRIKATDGTLAAKCPFEIAPTSGADFSLSVSPEFLNIVQGQSANTNFRISSKNNFKDAITFVVGGLPSGVSITFKDAADNIVGKYSRTPGGVREDVVPTALTPRPGEDVMVNALVEVAADTPLGPYDIALEAKTSTIFKAVPLQLLVSSTGASLGISPMSGPADTDISLSGSGFTANETVAITFAGTSITTVPGTITVAQDGSFTAVITAPSMTAGIHPVSVTGATSGITIDRPFGLKPSTDNSFVLYANPQKVDIPRGGSSTITAKIEPLVSFQSEVTLSVSGLDAISGATSSFSPAAALTPSIATPTTATLTINVPSGASEGRYPLVISAVSGAITQPRNITINVVPPADMPDFAISLAPNTLPISPNSSSNTTVTVTAINGFTGTVGLAVTMMDSSTDWPSGVSATTGNITPSATIGLGKKAVTFTVAADTQPGNWTFRIIGTSGVLEHSTDVMVICTPSGTTITSYASPRLDPTTITSSTPMDMEPPWGDKITINGLINDGSEASVITPSKVDVAPDTLASLPEGASDMLGRVTNIDSSSPVDGVEWNLGFPFDSDNLSAAGLTEENLKVAYLNPDTGTWTEVTTIIDTTNKIAYASPDHFSSWTLIGTPAPPPSTIVTQFSSGGSGGGGGGDTGFTNVSQSTTSNGRFIEDVIAESADGKVELSIPENTTGKNRNGQPIYSLSIKPRAAPSAPPTDSKIVGLVYDIGPSGATFEPPINLTFTYNESQIPTGVAEENLGLVTWEGGEWVELEGSTVDTNSNTITAPVSHFTIFTIVARMASAAFEISAFDISPAVVNPGESVTISATITNTGDLTGSHEVTLMINKGVTTIEEVSLAGHASQQLTFTVVPHNVGSYTVDVNGISGTFIVRETPVKPEEEPQPTLPEVTSEAQPTPSEAPMKPSEAQPVPPEAASAAQPTPSEAPMKPSEAQPTAPEVPAATQVSLWLIIGIVASGIFIGVTIWQLVTRRKAS